MRPCSVPTAADRWYASNLTSWLTQGLIGCCVNVTNHRFGCRNRFRFPTRLFRRRRPGGGCGRFHRWLNRNHRLFGFTCRNRRPYPLFKLYHASGPFIGRTKVVLWTRSTLKFPYFDKARDRTRAFTFLFSWFRFLLILFRFQGTTAGLLANFTRSENKFLQ